MRIYTSINKFTFDKKGLEKELGRIIDNIFYASIHAFGEVAARAVPIHTGMARGSFLNLRTFLENHGYTLNDIPDLPQAVTKSGQPYRYTHTQSIKVGSKRTSNFTKTPRSSKIYFTTKTAQIYKRKKLSPKFTYETTVIHYNLNDVLSLQSNAGNPWQSFAKGKAAFLNKFKEMSNRLAIKDVNKFILTTTITPGKQSPLYPFRDRSRNRIL